MLAYTKFPLVLKSAEWLCLPLIEYMPRAMPEIIISAPENMEGATDEGNINTINPEKASKTLPTEQRKTARR